MITDLTQLEDSMDVLMAFIVVCNFYSTMLFLSQQYQVLLNQVSNLNYVTKPWVICFHEVYKGKYTLIFTYLLWFEQFIGMLMDIYGYQMPQWIYNGLAMILCDVPASRKIWGIVLFSHKVHMCDQCMCTTVDIQLPTVYDIDSTFSQLIIFLVWFCKEIKISCCRMTGKQCNMLGGPIMLHQMQLAHILLMSMVFIKVPQTWSQAPCLSKVPHLTSCITFSVR